MAGDVWRPVLPGVIVGWGTQCDGIAQFVKTVQSVQERYRIVLLFSAVVEKNYEEMIHTICSQTTPSAVVVTEIKGDRIVPAGELSEVFAKYTDAQIVTEPDIEKAFERACTLRQDGLLFCCGIFISGRGDQRNPGKMQGMTKEQIYD